MGCFSYKLWYTENRLIIKNKEEGVRMTKFFKILFFVFKIGVDEALERIKHFSFDVLTGLYNRRGIKCVENDFSLIFIDLDNFKKINDNFGYSIGDEILQKFSDILKKISRNTDLFIRWGGDEFVLILPNTSARDAEIIVYRIKEKVKDKNLSIDFSYGIIEKEEAGEEELKDIIHQVSSLMQIQKNNKKQKKE